jgi:inositol 1,4,5-triphosphate receptor type 1
MTSRHVERRFLIGRADPLHNRYTFSFHLLHIVIGNDILQRVIQAVTKNGVSLLYVAVLMFIIIYIYTLMAFSSLRDYYDHEEGAHCDTMAACLLTSVRLGLLSGGGLGDALKTIKREDSAMRTTFDLTFFIFVTIIGLNVVCVLSPNYHFLGTRVIYRAARVCRFRGCLSIFVITYHFAIELSTALPRFRFGIIVDTFSELRDDKYRIETAMTSQCFICGLKSSDLDRYGRGWNEHIKHEHHMWNYLYFFRHLDSKDATDFTYVALIFNGITNPPPPARHPQLLNASWHRVT